MAAIGPEAPDRLEDPGSRRRTAEADLLQKFAARIEHS